MLSNAESGAVSCAWCSHPYRAPRWGRHYHCGACGRQLSGTVRRRLGAAINWTLPAYAIAVVLVVGLLVRVGLDRAAARVNTAAQPQLRPADFVALPVKYREHLQQRIKWLEADLQTSPRDPVLLTWLAESYRDRWLFERARGYAGADDSRRSAVAYTERLEQVDTPTADIRQACQILQRHLMDPDHLVWGTGRTGSMTSHLSTLSEDRMALLLGDTGPPTPGLVSAPAVVVTSGGPRASSRSFVPGGGFSGIYAAEGAPSGMRLTDEPTPPEDVTEDQLRKLRSRAAANREDASTLDKLGRLLEQRGVFLTANASPDEHGAAEPYFREAARTFRRAAAAVRSKCRIASFELAAGQDYLLTGDLEEATDAFTRATQNAPYAPVIWRELYEVQRKRKQRDQAAVAWREYQQWTFPRPTIPQP